MKISINNGLLVMISVLAQAESGIDYGGNLRTGVQYHDSQGSAGTDLAIGATLHAQSKPLAGVSCGMTVHTTNVLFNQNNALGVTFYDSNANAYATLSEAYIKGEIESTTIILGRQTLDTPFLDSDDIGMIPNTFEAYTLVNQDIADLQIAYSFVRNIAGIDADVPERFSDINGGSGLHVLGLAYEGFENTRLDAWGYNAPSISNYAYFEADYENAYKIFSYTLGAQVVMQDFKGKNNKIFGLRATVREEAHAITLALAYNKIKGVGADNGLGGGPFFTSSEHMTLADAGREGQVFLYGFEWDASDILTDGLALSLYKVDLYDDQNNDGDEVDIVVNYPVRENLSFDAIYSKIDNTDVSGDKFDNFRFFANYSF